MTKNIIAFIKIYLSFLLLSAFLYSCCSETYQIRSFKSITLYNANDRPQTPVNSITEEFTFIALFSQNISLASNLKQSFIQSAYATSCSEEFLNQLDQESLIISLDKDFIYQENTISANTNIAEISELKSNIEFSYDTIWINFLNEFLDKAQFENQEYTFTLYIETTDGLQFEKQISATINL